VHPVRDIAWEKGALVMSVARSALRGSARVLLAIESESTGHLRWSIPVRGRTGCVFMRDEATGKRLRRATLRVHPHTIEVRVPISNIRPLVAAYVKVQAPRIFYDNSGWRELPVPSVPAQVIAVPEKVFRVA
jgi:hypothetical protein